METRKGPSYVIHTGRAGWKAIDKEIASTWLLARLEVLKRKKKVTKKKYQSLTDMIKSNDPESRALAQSLIEVL